MQQPARQPGRSTEFSTAYHLLEALNEVGIEYVFCNLGTDHVPIIEEIAHRTKLGERLPQFIRCPHENTAGHMAGGYALMTGRGQGVLVHVDVGTANSGNAMHNLFRTRLPALLMAGKAPYTTARELLGSRDTYVHFVQEPLDQASLVRPYLKWEWTLPSGVVVKEALRRAHSIMQSAPAGPVYLMMQRETLTQDWNVDEVRQFSAEQYGSTQGGQAPPELVDALAERIVAAEHPILITSYAGRSARATQAIAELSELAGIAVIESNATINIPNTLPCFVGHSPDQHVPSADVGILVDTDVPWFPVEVQPREQSFWAHIDIDILKPASPMWSFPGNLRMQGDSGHILTQLLEAVRKLATPAFRKKAAARLTRISAQYREFLDRAARLASDKGKTDAINPHYLLAELNKVLEPSDVVFNEGIRNAGAVLLQTRRSLHNTMMRSAGGGLGWSGGFALGAKLAAPERMMVPVLGDGSFYFGNPTSLLFVSQQYKLPIFMVVLDNSGWAAVKEATLRVYPKGDAASTDEFQSKLMPEADFGKIAEAFGAHGERLTDPGKVTAAIARCAQVVRSGRTAILHARVTRL